MGKQKLPMMWHSQRKIGVCCSLDVLGKDGLAFQITELEEMVGIYVVRKGLILILAQISPDKLNLPRSYIISKTKV